MSFKVAILLPARKEDGTIDHRRSSLYKRAEAFKDEGAMTYWLNRMRQIYGVTHARLGEAA